MSIYSGFPTRKIEQRYNSLITDTLNMLMQVVISYVERSKFSPFEQKFKKVFKHMEKLDGMKHSQPRFSEIIRPLANHIYFIEDISDTSDLFSESKIEDNSKRPKTSDNYMRQERKKSLDFERKTINLAKNIDKPAKKLGRYPVKYSISVKSSGERDRKNVNKSIHTHNTQKHDPPTSLSLKYGTSPAQNFSYTNPNMNNNGEEEFQNITMEQLMEKHKLVERRMSTFRKKRYMQPMQIQKIQQQAQQQEEVAYS